MKRLLLLIWLVSLPLLAAGQDYQAPEVKVSAEKVRIGEKLFLVHKVEPRQTIFSICKAYGVTSEELKAANPDLKDGLKAGSILYIPAGSEAVAAAHQETPAEQPSDTKADEPGGEDPDTPVRVIEHKVRLFESARSIARKYGIEVEDLLDYNGIRLRDITPGTVVLVPLRKEGGTVATEPDEPEENPEEKGEDTPDEPETPVRHVRWFSAYEPMQIALVLPFNAQTGNVSASFLNFYCGALMAVRDQKDQGVNVVLNVFDLAQGAEAILSDPKFKGSDLVIGPVEAATMDPFLRFSDEQGVGLVSPLDHKADSLADTHAFFFQVPASPRVQGANLSSALHAGVGDRILLVQGPQSDSLFFNQVENALRQKNLNYRKTTVGELPGVIQSYGTRQNPVKVIIGTENKTAATEVIRSLNALAKKNVPVETYCTHRVRTYETSDPDALFNVAAHVSAPYFVDYTDPKDRDFVLQYRALFSAEPDDFAFQGYDVLSYFITALTRQGTGFIDNADAVPMQGLHCNFQFRRADKESGWRNCATRLIFYDREDFAVSIAK